MRILAVTLRYPPRAVGGYEMAAADAVEGLRARGHEVTVLAGRSRSLAGTPGLLPWLLPSLDGDPEGDALRAGTLEHLRLTFHRGENARLTRHALRDTGADVLLWFDLALASLAPIVAARRLRRPTLGLLADAWPTNAWLRAWKERGGKPLRLALLTRAWRAWRRRVGLGRAFACSEYLRDQLVADGLERGELELLPLALAPALEASARGIEPPEREPGEPLACVATSMLWHGKGQHVLIEAVRRAVERGADLSLVLAGAGRPEYVDGLARAIDGAGLGARVRLAGRLGQDELGALYRGSHVLCMPSLWGEPFGRTTIEGMAHGLPVVGTRAGATPEIVRDAEEGRLVPPDDPGALAEALVELERDEPLRRRLGCAARERALSVYAHEPFVERLERALEEIASHPESAS